MYPATGGTALSEAALSKEEQEAISDLRSLVERWPPRLWILSQGSRLYVLAKENGLRVVSDDPELTVATIETIKEDTPMNYQFEVKAILRLNEPLTGMQQADVIAEVATVLRKYNGGGGGKIIEIDIGFREAEDTINRRTRQ